MPTAPIIVFVGCIIFMSHWFAALFARTKIPDVLWLFTIGILLGPVYGVVQTDDFGAVGAVFTTITLIFILFESGIDQRLEPLFNSLGGTAKITTYNFLGTSLVAGGIAYFNTDLGFLRSLMLGSIVGGTSSVMAMTLNCISRYTFCDIRSFSMLGVFCQREKPGIFRPRKKIPTC